jgi:hypothetical protein
VIHVDDVVNGVDENFTRKLIPNCIRILLETIKTSVKGDGMEKYERTAAPTMEARRRRLCFCFN